jgi:hypothetical protein
MAHHFICRWWWKKVGAGLTSFGNGLRIQRFSGLRHVHQADHEIGTEFEKPAFLCHSVKQRSAIMANPERDTGYTSDTNRTVYTRESNGTGWFVGIIVVLALLAIGYLVFSANSGPSTGVDTGASAPVTSTDSGATAPAPMTEAPAPETTPAPAAETPATPAPATPAPEAAPATPAAPANDGATPAPATP